MRTIIRLLFVSLFLFNAHAHIVATLWPWTGNVGKPEKLKPIAWYKVPFNEPSDICKSATGNEYLIPGDKAFVYVVSLSDQDGRIEMKTVDTLAFSNFDIEAICTDGKYYYLSEETYQQIHIVDIHTLQLVKTIPFHHGGGRNEGFESIAWIPNENHFILSTEKDPQLFTLTDENFQIKEQFVIAGIREVSAMTWYNNNWYVLSDEDATVYCVDWKSRTILRSWKIPVINPEGIVFKDNGEMIITSDDMARVFIFNPSKP